MKKCYLFWVAMLPIFSLFINSCKSDDDPVIPDAKGIISEGDTIYVGYGEQLNLNELFDIEPSGALGTLTYTISRQPSYVEGNDPNAEYTTVRAYDLSGNTLTSISGVRVPDPLNATTTRTRVVREGKLTVTLNNATSEVDQKEIVIVQDNKPALDPPIIKVVDNPNFTDGPNGKLLTIQTTGSARNFMGGSFTVSPIDYDPDNIVVRPQSGSTYIYAPGQTIGSSTQTAIATCAGGVNGVGGTGEYIIAFYCKSPGSSSAVSEAYNKAVALPATSTEVARLYVNVEYVAPNAVVGIALNADAIGKKGTASFWRNNANGRQLPQNFILMKLNDGTTRAYEPSTDGTILAGEFDQYLEGRTTQDDNNPGWWGYVALKQESDLPPVGTDVSFTVTHKAHFKQEGWTVKVTTKTTSANPETL